MKNLLVIGDVAWDVVMRPAAELVWGSDVYGRVDLFPGGAAANVAVWARRLGSAVRLVGKVGDDPPGRLMVEHLRSEGLAADLISAPGDDTTRIGVMVRADGEHAFVTDHSRPLKLTAADLPPSLLDGAGAVFLTGYAVFMAGSAGFAAELLHDARRRGIAVAFDPASRSLIARYGGRRLLEELGFVDILLANEDEAAALLGMDRSAAAGAGFDGLLDHARLVVVKQGPAGASAAWRGGLVSAPAPEIEVVDTTGAGDAFDAAFLHAWLLQTPLQESLRLANHLGGAVASRLGAQTR